MKIKILDYNDKFQLDNLIDLTEKNVSNEKFWLPISDKSREHFFDKKWTCFFGAFLDEQLIGTVGLFFNKNEYDESRKEIKLNEDRIAEVGRIMCHPDYRNKRVASRLMEEMMDYVNKSDLKILLATAHPENEPSQRLLRKYGFVKKGFIVKSGNYERDILTRKVHI